MNTDTYDKAKADQFHTIRGQALAKRAVEVALAGNHSLLLAVTEYGKDRKNSMVTIEATENKDNSYSYRQAVALAVAPHITPKSAKQFMALSRKRRSDLLLRSEMVVEVPAMPLEEMQRPCGEPFERIWTRVERARAILARVRAAPRPYALDSASERLLRRAVESLALPAIRVEQLQRVSQSIAALDGSDLIAPQHLAEAIQYARLFLTN